MKAALILTLLAWLVPPEHQAHNDEHVDDAIKRYATIAAGVHEVAGDDRQLVLFLLAVARHESSLTRAVHSGDVRGDKGKSWGLFQKYLGRSPDSPVPDTPYKARDIVGVDAASTRRAVEVATADLSSCIQRCGGQAMCVFKHYGGVGKNPPKIVRERLEARVRTYRKLAIKLAIESPKK